VIPKGWPMKRRKSTKVASQEAYEEAGLTGHIMNKQPIGSFHYVKRLAHKTILCGVRVFLFWVDRQLDDWPEKSARETRWFDPGDAVELVGEGGLAEIIKCFAGSRVRFVAGENPLGSPRACYNLTSRRYLLLPIQTRCMRLIRAARLTDRA